MRSGGARKVFPFRLLFGRPNRYISFLRSYFTRYSEHGRCPPGPLILHVFLLNLLCEDFDLGSRRRATCCERPAGCPGCCALRAPKCRPGRGPGSCACASNRTNSASNLSPWAAYMTNLCRRLTSLLGPFTLPKNVEAIQYNEQKTWLRKHRPWYLRYTITNKSNTHGNK